MATLSGNGGAENYWRSTSDRSRLALCQRLLRQRQPGERWWITTLLVEVTRDPAWRSETTTVASAGITRTTRQARRKRANEA